MAMNFAAFNQDHSHLAVGTTKGFRIYYTDPFSKAYETHEGDITLLEMLFSTSLVALVMSPRRLVITNTKRNSTICELTFPQTVLGVRLNRKRLVVVLEDQIFLYDISNMKLAHTIDTSANPHGVCALSPASDRCYVAYPLPQRVAPSSFTPPSHVPPNSPNLSPTSGHVLIFDAISLQAVNVIEAHRAPLSYITMDSSGTHLATASDKGTIIRVFSVPDGRKLAQFRRGSMPARIFSMAFNATSTLLCVSSGTETIHIFKLSDSQSGQDQLPSPTTPKSSAATPTSQRDRRSSNRSLSPESSDFGADADDRPTSPSSPTDSGRPHNGTLTGMLRRTSQNVSKTLGAAVGGYLPSAFSEMLEPARDFAWFKVPRGSYGNGGAGSPQKAPGSSGLDGGSPGGGGGGSSSNAPGASGGGGSGPGGGPVKTVVAMSSNSPQVMVVTSEGQYYVFNIDLENGGEGTLTKQFNVLDSGGEKNGSDFGVSPKRRRDSFKASLSD
ncbi:MAG: autophagy protein [Alyxoria varia]|nr:MAG: autophagy protein [Alyxoria varia]